LLKDLHSKISFSLYSFKLMIPKMYSTEL
jgi:hypothetical protein